MTVGDMRARVAAASSPCTLNSVELSAGTGWLKMKNHLTELNDAQRAEFLVHVISQTFSIIYSKEGEEPKDFYGSVSQIRQE